MIVATVSWSNAGDGFAKQGCSGLRAWIFDGGSTIAASSSPDIVPVPMSDASAVDPEEAFVASLSSCHMLFFLSLAARRGIEIDRYTDAAIGTLEKAEDGKLAMTRVVLRPSAEYGGDAAPQREVIEKLHHRAHELCFIANSVKSEIVTYIIT